MLLSAQPELVACEVALEQVVFEPTALNEFLQQCSMGPVADGERLSASTLEDSAALLEKCLACWIDFFFVPSPKVVVIYADHDEYTTLLAMNSAGVKRTRSALIEGGFRAIDGYERRW